MGMVESTTDRTLETLMRFSARRQTLLAHDLANLSTPGFRPVDVPVEGFQRSLRDAIDAVREGRTETLRLEDGEGVRFENGQVVLDPQPRGDNILFHDRTDADSDRLLADMAENTLAFRTAAELYRYRVAQILSAIRERP